MKAGKILILTLVVGLFACGSLWAAVDGLENATNNPDNLRVKLTGTDSAGQARTFMLEPKANKKVKANTEAAGQPEFDFQMLWDDGSIDNNIGTGSAEVYWDWYQVFMPPDAFFPFQVTSIQGYIGDGPAVGDPCRVVVFYDEERDQDPATGAVFAYQEAFTVQANDGNYQNDTPTWNVFDLTTPPTITNPADVWIGLILDVGVIDFPMPIDETDPQNHHFTYGWSAPGAPDPMNDISGIVNLANYGFYGDWCLRASGYFAAPNFNMTGVNTTDTCVYGYGDGDGFLDPGEWVDIIASFKNTGDVAATGVNATATVAGGSFNLTLASDFLGTIAPNQTVQAQFQGYVPLNAACGADLGVAVTLTAAERPFTWGPLPLGLLVGDYDPGTVIVEVMQNMDVWAKAPAGWTIDPAEGIDSWMSNDAQLLWLNNTPGSNDCAVADSDHTGGAFISDCTLASPVFNLDGGVDRAGMEYDWATYDFFGSTELSVEISSNGFATFDTIFTHFGGGTGAGNVFLNGTNTIDLGAYVGQTGLQVRFRYYADWEYFAQVDNVFVWSQNPATCADTLCVPPFQVWIVQGADWGTAYGMTTFCADMTDSTLPDFVDFYIDGSYVGTVVGGPPWCTTFDASMLALGPHTIQACAYVPGLGFTCSQLATFVVVGPVSGLIKADPPSGIAPFTVTKFTSNLQGGSGAYDVHWYFGNGVENTDDLNPENVLYLLPGDYLVTLVVTDRNSGEWFILGPYKVTAVELPLPFLDLDWFEVNQDNYSFE